MTPTTQKANAFNELFEALGLPKELVQSLEAEAIVDSEKTSLCVLSKIIDRLPDTEETAALARQLGVLHFNLTEAITKEFPSSGNLTVTKEEGIEMHMRLYRARRLGKEAAIKERHSIDLEMDLKNLHNLPVF